MSNKSWEDYSREQSKKATADPLVTPEGQVVLTEPKPEEKDFLGAARTFAEHGADVMAFGHYPQIEGGIRTLAGQDYTTARDATIERMQKDAYEHRDNAIAGKIAGVGGSLFVPFGVARLAGGLPKLAQAGIGAAEGLGMMAAQNPGDVKGKVDPIQAGERLENITKHPVMSGISMALPTIGAGLAGRKAITGVDTAADMATGAANLNLEARELANQYPKRPTGSQAVGRNALDAGIIGVGSGYKTMYQRSKDHLAETWGKIKGQYSSAEEFASNVDNKHKVDSIFNENTSASKPAYTAEEVNAALHDLTPEQAMIFRIKSNKLGKYLFDKILPNYTGVEKKITLNPEILSSQPKISNDYQRSLFTEENYRKKIQDDINKKLHGTEKREQAAAAMDEYITKEAFGPMPEGASLDTLQTMRSKLSDKQHWGKNNGEIPEIQQSRRILMGHIDDSIDAQMDALNVVMEKFPELRPKTPFSAKDLKTYRGQYSSTKVIEDAALSNWSKSQIGPIGATVATTTGAAGAGLAATGKFTPAAMAMAASAAASLAGQGRGASTAASITNKLQESPLSPLLQIPAAVESQQLNKEGFMQDRTPEALKPSTMNMNQKLEGFPIQHTMSILQKSAQMGGLDPMQVEQISRGEIEKNPTLNNMQKVSRINLLNKHGRVLIG